MKEKIFQLIKSDSKDEDQRRHEFILNSILIPIIILLSISTFLNVIKRFSQDYHQEDAIPISLVVSILFVFTLLYILSKKGFSKFSSYVLTSTLILLSSYMVYLWSVELQAPLLFFCLIIILSGVLISTRYAFLVAVLCSIILFLGLHFQKISYYQPNFYWKEKNWGLMEVIVVSVIFLIIATVSWLSNRETEKSLRRARRSEKALAKERDLLEIRVEERTRELQKAQMEKLDNVAKMAEFGNISSGLFHDFINPLTSLSLNIEQLKQTKSQKEQIKTNLKQASLATERMTDLIKSFRKQISDHDIKRKFSINNEIQEVLKLLDFQAKNNKVQLIFKGKNRVSTVGNPIRFSQVLTNLISNAIDSYPKKNNTKFKRKVLIELEKCKGNIILLVADNGQGIPKNIQDKIFDPYFTTKRFNQGSGVGLSLTKNILEKEFGGKIDLHSEKNKGTTFIIKFKRKEKHAIKRKTKS